MVPNYILVLEILQQFHLFQTELHISQLYIIEFDYFHRVQITGYSPFYFKDFGLGSLSNLLELNELFLWD